MSLPDDCFLTHQQLATVQKHANRLLDEASAVHVFPTPIERIMAAAKLTVVKDDLDNESLLKEFMKRAKSALGTVKSALGKIFGMIHTSDRLVLIDLNTPKPKLPFINLHEAGHERLPHQKSMYSVLQDSEQSLSPEVTDLFEREANVFASEVLFQGSVFAEEAHQSAFSVKVPIRLSKKYGASNYSTFRRYVRTSPCPSCVLVLNPAVSNKRNGFSAEVRRIIANDAFDRIFDGERFGVAITEAHLFGHLIPLGKRRMTATRRIRLTDRRGEARYCSAEAFTTTHQIFLLLKDEGPAPSIYLPQTRNGRHSDAYDF